MLHGVLEVYNNRVVHVYRSSMPQMGIQQEQQSKSMNVQHCGQHSTRLLEL